MGTATVNPSIILSGEAPKPTDALEAYARVQALKTQLGQQQLQQQALQTGQLENQQRQIALDQQKALNAGYASSFDPTTGKIDSDKLMKAVVSSGHAELAPKIVEGQLALEKQAGDIKEQKLKALDGQANLAGDFGKQLQVAGYDPNLFVHGMTTMAHNGGIDPQQAIGPINAVKAALAVDSTGGDPNDPTGKSAKAIVKRFSDQALQSSEKWAGIQAQQQTAAARQKQADTGAAELAIKQVPQLASQLATAKDKDSYAQTWYAAQAQDPKLAAKFPHPDQFNPQTTPDQVRQIGMNPEQQIAAAQAKQNEADRVRHEGVEEKQGNQRIGIENSRLGIENAKLGIERFNAGLDAKGNPLSDADKTALKAATQNTSDGRLFIDQGEAFKNLPKGQQIQLAQAARNAGIPMVSPQDAGKIQKLDTVQQNLDGVFDVFAKNAASNAATRVTGVPYMANKLGTTLETNPDLKAAENDKLGALETVKDVIGRANPHAIAQVEGMMPTIDDTKAAVERKRQEFKQFIAQHLNATTHNVAVKSAPATSAPAATTTTGDPNKDRLINHYLNQ